MIYSNFIPFSRNRRTQEEGDVSIKEKKNERNEDIIRLKHEKQTITRHRRTRVRTERRTRWQSEKSSWVKDADRIAVHGFIFALRAETFFSFFHFFSLQIYWSALYVMQCARGSKVKSFCWNYFRGNESWGWLLAPPPRQEMAVNTPWVKEWPRLPSHASQGVTEKTRGQRSTRANCSSPSFLRHVLTSNFGVIPPDS